jgi:hypothetical protein
MTRQVMRGPSAEARAHVAGVCGGPMYCRFCLDKRTQRLNDKCSPDSATASPAGSSAAPETSLSAPFCERVRGR